MSRWRLPVRFGVGGVAIGNGFAPMTDAEADATLDAAWQAGTRYFDTSPFYGFGLSERRFGHFLHRQSRDTYTLSTKVGRIFTAGQPPDHGLWKDPSPFSYRYDYTAEGTRRSIEDSLQRLGVERIDIVFVHDLSPDNDDDLGGWERHLDVATRGAFPALCELRDRGIIRAWGMGVNRIEPILEAMRTSEPDICLLATQYSLMNHEHTIERLFPELERRDVKIVVGAPFEAGYLSGKDRYDYGGTIPAGAPERRARMEAIATEHGVDLRTVALQFAAAPPVVAAVLPGGRGAAQVQANARSMQTPIPHELWDALKRERLIAHNAPVPSVTQHDLAASNT